MFHFRYVRQAWRFLVMDQHNFVVSNKSKHATSDTIIYREFTITVCKKNIFRDLIEDYSFYSHGKIRIALEYRHSSIS